MVWTRWAPLLLALAVAVACQEGRPIAPPSPVATPSVGAAVASPTTAAPPVATATAAPTAAPAPSTDDASAPGTPTEGEGVSTVQATGETGTLPAPVAAPTPEVQGVVLEPRGSRPGARSAPSPSIRGTAAPSPAR